VARIDAVFLGADHAAYVDHWLRILGQDARAVFTAARLAQNATLYLHGNIVPGER
jgi:antirestriction protein ArdC